jgi:hypothetical protein
VNNSNSNDSDQMSNYKLDVSDFTTYRNIYDNNNISIKIDRNCDGDCSNILGDDILSQKVKSKGEYDLKDSFKLGDVQVRRKSLFARLNDSQGPG